MIYRQLGKTGLEISEVSLGLEWLYKKREAEITEVLQHAIENGVNYFDIIFNFEDFLKQIKVAIKPKRDQIILMHHLGSSEYKGKYKKTRSIKKCSETYERFLQIMETDYVDILFIHFVHTLKEFEDTWAEGGVKDLALKFKEEGKARFIGMSTHLYEIAIEAAKSGVVDVIMVQLNMANHSHPKRQEFLTLCAQKNVGVIAMKPFAGGKLFQKNKTITLPKYITAGHDIGQKKITQTITSAQCIHYVLNQI
nr:aldo/keto reductase [Asgard group archaeon]